MFYVYIGIQNPLGYNQKYLKIGHTKNPKSRFYSFQDYQTEFSVIHIIETSTKELAICLERAFVRILKDRFPKNICLDCYDWFFYDEKMDSLLMKWGVSLEK